MAPPMPPDAPVTRAFLPVRSNIGWLLQLGGKRDRPAWRGRHTSDVERRLHRRDIIRRADGGGGRTRRDPFHEASQDLAGSNLIETVDPLGGHVAHAFAPAHRPG